MPRCDLGRSDRTILVVRSEIEQHLRRELASGACTLDVLTLEGFALWAYVAARRVHTLHAELADPRTLAHGLGLETRVGPVPSGTPAILVERTIVHRLASGQTLGLVVLHEVAHWLLRGRAHTHADVVALTLCLAVPDAALRSALKHCELSSEGLLMRQRHVPGWALEIRLSLATPQLREGNEAA